MWRAWLAAVVMAACREPPKPFEVARSEAEAKMKAGDAAAAGAAYERSLALEPKQPLTVWDAAIDAWVRAGRLDEAAALTEKSLPLRAGAGEKSAARDVLGQQWLARGDVTQAEAWFRKALAVNARDAAAHAGLAAVLARRGGVEGAGDEALLKDARDEAEAALKVDPSSRAAKEVLRDVLTKVVEAQQRQRLSLLADLKMQPKEQQERSRARAAELAQAMAPDEARLEQVRRELSE